MAAKRNATTELTDRNWDQEDEAEEPGKFSLADENVLAQRKIKVARRRKLSGGEPGDTKSPFKSFAGFTGLSKPAQSAAPTFNFAASGNTSTPLFSFGANGSSSTENKPTPTTVSTEKGNGTEAEPPKPTFSFVLQSSSSATVKSDEAKPTFSFGSSNSSQSSVLSPTNSTDSPSKANKAKYYSKLKTLNESVSKWIKEHVDKNPLCILTPIFKDYETHLAEIETFNPDSNKKETTQERDNISTVKSDAKVPSFPTFSFGKTSETSKSSDQKSSPFTDTTLSTSGTTQMSFTPVGTDVSKPPQGGFSFTSSTNSSNLMSSTGSTTSGFSFKPLVETSASTASAGTSGGGGEDEEYVPPTAEVKTVTEDGAVYTKRCKLFYKLDKEWKEKGVGNLHIKPVDDGKTQLIVRADNNLGTILLNIFLSEMMPTNRQGKNNVMMVTVPNPPIKGIEGSTPMLIRVKTSEDADELLEKLNKHKA